MAYAASVERWLACKWGIAFGYASHQVVAVMPEDERENYGCSKSEIIDSSKFQLSDFREDGRVYQVAVLHESGRFADESVIAALNQACIGCKYFKDPYSR